MIGRSLVLVATCVALGLIQSVAVGAQARPRARELGVAPGILPPGTLNSITDVAGVLVGQVTIIEGDSVRTGITAILPHSGNLFLQRVPAAIVVGNGFGKLLGTTQVNELGELETPILLTCTLCVWKAADAMVEWMLGQQGMQSVRSINPVVGETNDGYELNAAIRSRPITAAQVRQALTSARERTGRGRKCRRRNRNASIRVERRNRNFIAEGARINRRLDRRSARSVQLRRSPPDHGSASRARARTPQVLERHARKGGRIDHDRRRYRRAAL